MVKNLPEMQETWVQSLVGKIPWRRTCNPLQYFCLESSIDIGAWRATVCGVAKSQRRLSMNTFKNNWSKFGFTCCIMVIVALKYHEEKPVRKQFQ